MKSMIFKFTDLPANSCWGVDGASAVTCWRKYEPNRPDLQDKQLIVLRYFLLTLLNKCISEEEKMCTEGRKKSSHSDSQEAERVFSPHSSHSLRWPGTCGIKKVSMPLTLKRRTT